jgi:D-beta-D-heptose 7-phosphate kinase/D-beta-D-heptose 1-phosphate adenosyltransferase
VKHDFGKILPFEKLKEWRNSLIGEKIVVTNGCFDIVHLGHIHYLRKAKDMGTLLLVGLNSDKSVKLLKGKNRPINNEVDRCLFLLAFDFVDFTCVFPDKTATDFLDLSRPEVYIKGGDYSESNIINSEKEVLIRHKSKIVFTDYVENKSTSNIISVINSGEHSGHQRP